MDISEYDNSISGAILPGRFDLLMIDNPPCLFLFKLFILSLQVEFDKKRHGGTDHTRATHHAPAGIVARLLAVGEHERRIKVSNSSAHEIANGQGGCAFGPRPWERCADPAHAEVVRRVRARRHQEHGKVPAPVGRDKHSLYQCQRFLPLIQKVMWTTSRFPSRAKIIGIAMWKPRSCVYAAWNDTPSETKKAKKYGGDVSSRVLVSSYPRVPTIDGKKLLKDSAVMRLISRTTNM